MNNVVFRNFIEGLGRFINRYVWAGAFCFSVIFHIMFLVFLWFCCEIHTMLFPQVVSQHVIEIEFVK